MDRTPKLEWAFGIFGLALMLGAVGFMGVQMFQDESAYPDLQINLVHVVPQAGRYLVVLEVRNRGGASAQGVRVSGRLHAPAAVETSVVVIDYVAAGSSRRAGLYFRNDPSRHRLDLHAEGYQEP